MTAAGATPRQSTPLRCIANAAPPPPPLPDFTPSQPCHAPSLPPPPSPLLLVWRTHSPRASSRHDTPLRPQRPVAQMNAAAAARGLPPSAALAGPAQPPLPRAMFFPRSTSHATRPQPRVSRSCVSERPANSCDKTGLRPLLQEKCTQTHTPAAKGVSVTGRLFSQSWRCPAVTLNPPCTQVRGCSRREQPRSTGWARRVGTTRAGAGWCARQSPPRS